MTYVDEPRDPLLAEKIKRGSGVSFASSQGFTFPSIPENALRTVAAYSQLIWEMSNLKKGVTTREVINNTKVFFTSPELRGTDVLWMSHCAGSLREISDSQFEANCIKYLKCLPKRGDSDEARRRYERLSLIKEWLHNIAHLGDEDRMFVDGGTSMLAAAQGILNSSGITEIDERVFDQICTAFIMELNALFGQCIKGNV